MNHSQKSAAEVGLVTNANVELLGKSLRMLLWTLLGFCTWALYVEARLKIKHVP